MRVAVYGINHSAGIVMRNKKKKPPFYWESWTKALKIIINRTAQ